MITYKTHRIIPASERIGGLYSRDKWTFMVITPTGELEPDELVSGKAYATPAKAIEAMISVVCDRNDEYERLLG